MVGISFLKPLRKVCLHIQLRNEFPILKFEVVGFKWIKSCCIHKKKLTSSNNFSQERVIKSR